MAWATSKGFNFRQTAAYVTDGTNQMYVEDDGDGTGENYPVTRSIGGENVTFGWESTYSDQCRNRTTGSPYNPKLAGMHQNPSGGSEIIFRVDLPETGNYKIRIAAGDAVYATEAKFQVRDTTTNVLTVTQTTATDGYFVDAGGTARTGAGWVSDNVQEECTFSTTIFRFALQPPTSGGSNISHIEIEQVTGGASIVPQAMASYRQQ